MKEPHVFISYGQKMADRSLLQLIEDRLAQNDFKAWWDKRIDVGDKWEPTIDEKLHEAFVVVILITKEANASSFVQYEWIYAMGLGIEIIPLLVQNPNLPQLSKKTWKETHQKLQKLQYLELEASDELAWKKLMERLKVAKERYFAKTASQQMADLSHNMSRITYSYTKLASIFPTLVMSELEGKVISKLESVAQELEGIAAGRLQIPISTTSLQRVRLLQSIVEKSKTKVVVVRCASIESHINWWQNSLGEEYLESTKQIAKRIEFIRIFVIPGKDVIPEELQVILRHQLTMNIRVQIVFEEHVRNLFPDAQIANRLINNYLLADDKIATSTVSVNDAGEGWISLRAEDVSDLKERLSLLAKHNLIMDFKEIETRK